MKRFHVHVAVRDLHASIDFYSTLFGQPPSVEKADYAKWMMEDPRINFAISARGVDTGLDHLGLQVDTPEELLALSVRVRAASGAQTLEQSAARCCYAVSDKHWTLDPQGIAWEQFHTLGEAVQFGDDRATPKGACCIPLAADTVRAQ